MVPLLRGFCSLEKEIPEKSLTIPYPSLISHNSCLDLVILSIAALKHLHILNFPCPWASFSFILLHIIINSPWNIILGSYLVSPASSLSYIHSSFLRHVFYHIILLITDLQWPTIFDMVKPKFHGTAFKFLFLMTPIHLSRLVSCYNNSPSLTISPTYVSSIAPGMNHLHLIVMPFTMLCFTLGKAFLLTSFLQNHLKCNLSGNLIVEKKEC